MTFLKRVGQLIVAGLKIVTPLVFGIGPLVSAENPNATPVVAKVEDVLTQLQSVIVTTEAIGQSLGLAGDAKLRAAAPQVAQLVLQWAHLVGHQIENGPLFTQGTTKIADGMADVLNSFHEKNAQTIDLTA